MRGFVAWHGGLEGIDQGVVESFVDHLKEMGYSSSTIRQKASAVKRYAKMHGVYFEITNIPTTNQEIPTPLSEEEVWSLIDGIEDIRDKAIVGLLYDAALRISELVGLNCDDVDFNNRIVRLDHRKKSRVPQGVPFGERVGVILSEYMDERKRRGFTKKQYPELFLGDNGRIHERTIRSNLAKHSSRVIGKHVNPHLLRHSRASVLRAKGASIDMLREFLGHRDIRTTVIYARINPVELKHMLDEVEG